MSQDNITIRTGLAIKVYAPSDVISRIRDTELDINGGMAASVSLLCSAKNGKYGDTPALAVEGIIRSKEDNNTYLLNSVTVTGWKSGSAVKGAKGQDATWIQRCVDESRSGPILPELVDIIECRGKKFKSQVNQSIEVLKAHKAALNRWHVEHTAWLKAKAKWEDDHPEYMSVRHQLDLFEQSAIGRKSECIRRLPLWLGFLKSNPELAAWDGSPPTIAPLTSAQAEKVERSKYPESQELKELLIANPTLKKLDSVHQEYEKLYVRRRKRKRHIDGYDHPPTLTLPSAKHKRPLRFSGPQTPGVSYSNFVFDPKTRRGHLDILLPVDTGTGWGTENVRLDIMCDRRFRHVEVIDAKAGRYLMDGMPLRLQALTFQDYGHDWADAKFVAEVTCPQPAKQGIWRHEKVKGIKGGKGKKKLVGLVPGASARIANVDMGIRNPAWMTCVDADGDVTSVVATAVIKPVIDPAHRRKHDRDLREARTKRGKPVRGEKSHVKLQSHITNMDDEIAKQLANRIVKQAVAWGADAIVFENLDGLGPSATKGRGLNKRLSAWNRVKIIEYAKRRAAMAGIVVAEVNPAGTSRTCSCCGEIGARYDMTANGPVLSAFGKLFKCLECGYHVNADHNASICIGKQFCFGYDWFSAWHTFQKKSKSSKANILQDMQRRLAATLTPVRELVAA